MEEVLMCLKELVEASEQLVHLVDYPTPTQKRVQEAINKANQILFLSSHKTQEKMIATAIKEMDEYAKGRMSHLAWPK